MSHETFIHAVETYREAAEYAIRAEEDYRVMHAKALTEAEGSNAEKRKAFADQVTSKLRLARDEAALRREIALHMVQYLKAAAGRDGA